jgi:DNA polymerase-3 subunit gamma/tau
MHITLYRKYRPSTFEEVAGEGDVIKTIKSSLRNDTMAHAYLFTGPRGVGKTTTARLIAKGLNCLTNGITDTPCNTCENCVEISKNKFIDLIEIDAASNRGIDEIRSLKDRVNYQPSRGRKKVYIIDEVHMLTKEAFNALLKTLEEPPSHVIFILATTEPDKILDTIISRCQRYDFKPVTLKELKKHLLMIASSENIKVDEKSLELIYEKSGGSVRDAISIFEKVISSCYGEEITLENTEKILGVIPGKKLEKFLEIVTNNNLEKGIEFLDHLWDDSINVEEFLKSFAYYIKELMIKNELPLDTIRGIGIIENIFEVMGKFKYEEDKRLLGYVVLHKIITVRTTNPPNAQPKINKETNINNEVLEVVEQLKEENKKLKEELTSKEIENSSNNVDTKNEIDEPRKIEKNYIDVSLEEVKAKWNEIVNESKRRKMPLISFLSTAIPIKVENKVLHIGFYPENKFHKESMEKPHHNEVFLGVLKDKLGGDIKVQYDILTKTNKVIEEKSDFVEKVMDFFDGELI